MSNNKAELSINTEVLRKMSEIAAKEVAGVKGISKKAIDLKGAIKTKSAFQGVMVESVNGAIEININLCVVKGVNVKEIAEKVQENIKDKVQTMTGTAVTKVNVTIADIAVETEEEN